MQSASAAAHMGGEDRLVKAARGNVGALLTEQPGGELANPPEFERISNEVRTRIEEDEALRPQLEEALRELGNI